MTSEFVNVHELRPGMLLWSFGLLIFPKGPEDELSRSLEHSYFLLPALGDVPSGIRLLIAVLEHNKNVYLLLLAHGLMGYVWFNEEQFCKV